MRNVVVASVVHKKEKVENKENNKENGIDTKQDNLLILKEKVTEACHGICAPLMGTI